MSEQTRRMKADVMKSSLADDGNEPIQKERLRNKTGLSVTGVLNWLHNPVTRVLIGIGISAQLVTVLWLLVSFGAYGLSALGVPWGFVAGSLVLFLAMVLDLCDGEIARNRARSMTDVEDLTTHIQGMYLDRMFHLIAGPIWPLAVSWGLYRMTDQPIVLAAGAAICIFHLLRRCRGMLAAYLLERFRPRLEQMLARGEFAEPDAGSASHESLCVRLIRAIELWIGNGKRFNFLVLVGGTADVALLAMYGPEWTWALFGIFAVSGAVSVLLIGRLILVSIFRKSLLAELCRSCRSGLSVEP